MEDQEPLSPYFGDPRGLHWSAFPHDAADVSENDAEDFTIIGRKLRVMWDEGGGPLWDGGGLLPDDPAWLRQALGLSEGLIEDLLTWMADMNAAHWRNPIDPVLQRGAHLTERVQTEVGSAYIVEYWP